MDEISTNEISNNFFYSENEIPLKVLEYGFDFDWEENDVLKLNYL